MTHALLPLPAYLSEIFGTAFETLNHPKDAGTVKIADRPDLADFQCNGALSRAKAAGTNPRELAQAVIDALPEDLNIGELSIAGPGFINIKLSDSFLAKAVSTLSADARLGCPAFSNQKIFLESGGYNIAKTLHIGHVRSTLLGDALLHIMKFAGDSVVTDVHLGDWGTQMGMLIEAVKQEQPELPYFDANFSGPYPEESPVSLQDLNRLYPAASSLCKEDETAAAQARTATAELQAGRPGYRALWRHFVDISIADLKENIAPYDVDFDLWLGESDVQPLIPDMVEKMVADGHAQRSDGALIIPVAAELGREKAAPLMLQKSDGAATYATTDLATLQDRVTTYAPDSILYVVDDRQQEHFQQVFAAAYKTGLVPQATTLEHLKFGTVNGPDGKPFKTRAGNAVSLRDVTNLVLDVAKKRLLESGRGAELDDAALAKMTQDIGMATIKFAELSNERTTSYILDLDAFSAAEGKTGPYLLYSGVRMKSILTKAAEAGLAAGDILLTCPQDRALALKLLGLNQAIHAAYKHRAPHHLCLFAYELAQAFSAFYAQCNIMQASDPATQASWLTLCKLTLAELELTLNLLGITIPEKM